MQVINEPAKFLNDIPIRSGFRHGEELLYIVKDLLGRKGIRLVA